MICPCQDRPGIARSAILETHQMALHTGSKNLHREGGFPGRIFQGDSSETVMRVTDTAAG